MSDKAKATAIFLIDVAMNLALVAYGVWLGKPSTERMREQFRKGWEHCETKIDADQHEKYTRRRKVRGKKTPASEAVSPS